MTEPIGYNNEQFDDLPNEDASWNKMSHLLDKEDKRRRIVPFWIRLSALGVLLLGLGIGGWMLFSDKDETRERTEVVNKNIKDNGQAETKNEKAASPEEANGAGTAPGRVDEKLMGTSSESKLDPVNSKPGSMPSVIPEQNKAYTPQLHSEKNVTPVIDRKKSRKTKGREIGQRSIDISMSVPRKQDKAAVTKDPSGSESFPAVAQKTIDNPAIRPPASKIDAVRKETDDPEVNLQDKLSSQKPSDTTTAITDPIPKKPVMDTNSDTAKLKEAVAETPGKDGKKNPLLWTLGLTFQQPIAFGSQGTSAYNYRGKKSFIADHLPGIYFTAGRNKWWLAAEFSYAVPQPVKQVYFSQATKFTAADSTIRRERYSIEKIYYHQLSVGGNYMLLPRVSAGVGGTYHLLTGAVTKREVRSSNVTTGETQTLTTLAPVQGYKDSFFFKSTAAAFLQSEYHWNRVKLGLRYTYRLQPYMRYTKPDGQIEDARNNTLQLLLRFQLWKKPSKSP